MTGIRPAITQGTTPTFTFTGPADLDLSEAHEVYVTFDGLFTKSGEDVEVDGNVVSVFLGQEETLQFVGQRVRAQINWTYHREEKILRAASKKITISVDENLLKEVVE